VALHLPNAAQLLDCVVPTFLELFNRGVAGQCGAAAALITEGRVTAAGVQHWQLLNLMQLAEGEHAVFQAPPGGAAPLYLIRSAAHEKVHLTEGGFAKVLPQTHCCCCLCSRQHGKCHTAGQDEHVLGE
jgi:hypothetical protein